MIDCRLLYICAMEITRNENNLRNVDNVGLHPHGYCRHTIYCKIDRHNRMVVVVGIRAVVVADIGILGVVHTLLPGVQALLRGE